MGLQLQLLRCAVLRLVSQFIRSRVRGSESGEVWSEGRVKRAIGVVIFELQNLQLSGVYIQEYTIV
jgi:hypothetical protein